MKQKLIDANSRDARSSRTDKNTINERAVNQVGTPAITETPTKAGTPVLMETPVNRKDC
jgi:hypothetical protein